jgi:hypothetical protein
MLSNGSLHKPSLLRFGAFGRIAAAGFVSFLAQLAVGSDFRVVILFTLAIVFGLGAVHAGGGLRSTLGILNAILLGEFLLIAIALKVLLMEATDHNLYSPITTSMVMAFGFLGLWIATAAVQRAPRPARCLMPANFSAREYLAFAIVVLLISCGGYVLGMRPDLEGQGLQTGGILGYARTLGSFTSLAIVPTMFYAWKSGHRRFLSHPLVLLVLLFETAIGIWSTGKQGAMEPLMLYGVVAVMRFGLTSKKVWILGLLGAMFYAGLVYPYSQYVRFNGGREGLASYRVEAMKETIWRLLTDPTFRSMVSSHIDSKTRIYWDAPSLTPFSRLAMVCEADRLISATERTQSYTAWETISWGFKLLTPRILLPNKPAFGANNYLAHIAGDAGIRDDSTQWAYGIFANLFNAFGMTGVAVGSVLTFGCFYYWLTLFFGNPVWTPKPVDSALWLLLVVASYHHVIVETSVSNLIASLVNPAMILLMALLARTLARFLPRHSGHLGLQRRAMARRRHANRAASRDAARFVRP